MGQVQVNLRVSEDVLEGIERVRGDEPRNRFLVRAVKGVIENFEPPVAPEPMPTQPTSVRAPRGCRVANVPREVRDLV